MSNGNGIFRHRSPNFLGSTVRARPNGYVGLPTVRQEEGVVELDEERKAAMVSNLLVVLCSEQATQQVVNTGSLYQ